MVEYPTDLKIDKDTRNIYLSDTNDLARVSGTAGLRQSVAIHAMNAVRQFIGKRITGPNIGLLEERLRQSLNRDPQIEEIASVDVQEFDRGSDSVIVDVKTIEDKSFTLEVPA